MEFNSERTLSSYLQPGEKLLWTGKPYHGLIFRKPDIFLVPFSMLWISGIVSWEISVFNSDASFFFLLFGVPPILFGLYLMIGRFIYDSKKRTKTVYGLTNERALILSGLFTQSLRSINLKAAQEVWLKLKSDGRGTIMFGGNNWSSMYFWNPLWLYGNPVIYPSFEMIDNVIEVYQLVQNLPITAKTFYFS